MMGHQDGTKKYLAFTKDEGMWSDGTVCKEFGAFSNFSKHPTTVELLGDQVRVRTVEHAFQAMKAQFVGRKKGWKREETAAAVKAICGAGTARQAKGLAGRGKASVVRCDDPAVWEAWSDGLSTDAMLACLRGKFADPELARLLRGTGRATIVESSRFDKIWGSGYGLERSSTGDLAPGATNKLGKCLMVVREEVCSRMDALEARAGDSAGAKGPAGKEEAKASAPGKAAASTAGGLRSDGAAGGGGGDGGPPGGPGT